MISALPLASARLRKLWIPSQNNLLDGALCKSVFYFHIFSSFLVFKRDFNISADFSLSLVQGQSPGMESGALSPFPAIFKNLSTWETYDSRRVRFAQTHRTIRAGWFA